MRHFIAALTKFRTFDLNNGQNHLIGEQNERQKLRGSTVNPRSNHADFAARFRMSIIVGKRESKTEAKARAVNKVSFNKLSNNFITNEICEDSNKIEQNVTIFAIEAWISSWNE